MHRFFKQIIIAAVAAMLSNGCKRAADTKHSDAGSDTKANESAATDTTDGAYTIHEQSLGKLAGGPIKFVVSPDAHHWACVWDNLTIGRRTVTADGKVVGEYGGVHAVQYTAGNVLVYVAGPDPFRNELNAAPTPNNDMVLVIDGKASPGYSLIAAVDPTWVASSHPSPGFLQTLVFSPDGKHIAFSGSRGTDAFVNVDGKEFGPYGQVAEIIFSLDSKHSGWITNSSRGDQFAVTVDGGKSIAIDGIAKYLRFSPDGSSWIYTVMSKAFMQGTYGVSGFGSEKSTIVRRGANSATYPGLDQPGEFSFDGKHVFSHTQDCVAFDQKTLKIPAERGNRADYYSIRFDPATNHLICLGGRAVLTLDLDGNIVTQESRDVLWIAESPDHRRTVTAKGRAYSEIWDLGNGKMLKLDLNKQISENRIWLGPANKYAMLIARLEPLQGQSGTPSASLAIEDQIGNIYTAIDPHSVASGSDGVHVAYAAAVGEIWRPVVDFKMLSPEYDKIGSAPFAFDASNVFRFIALRKGEMLAVKVTGL